MSLVETQWLTNVGSCTANEGTWAFKVNPAPNMWHCPSGCNYGPGFGYGITLAIGRPSGTTDEWQMTVPPPPAPERTQLAPPSPRRQLVVADV